MSLRVSPITEKLRGHYWRDSYILKAKLFGNSTLLEPWTRVSENLIIFIPLNNLQNNNSEIQYDFKTRRT